MNNQTTGSIGTQTDTQHQASRSIGYLRSLLFVGLLSLAGNAAAVITVDLTITNDTDAFGNFTLIKGDKVRVEWEITEDTDGDLHHKDKLQILRVSDDEVLASILRGRKGKTNGKVALKLNETGELVYVRYVRKGNSGTEITRIGHPDDDDPSIQAIDPVSGDEVTREIYNLRNGAVSISHRDFRNEDNNPDHVTECIWNTNRNDYGYYLVTVTGAACDLSARIALPHGRTVTEMHCTFFDNSAGNSLDARLNRTNLETGSSQTIFFTSNTTDSANIQIVSDTTVSASTNVIDNINYTYSVFSSWSGNDFDALGTDARIYGCSVRYQ